MHSEIADVVARNTQTADGIVDGERQADERAPGHGPFALGLQHLCKVGQPPNLLVVDDGGHVVEHERRREAVEIDETCGKPDA